LETDSRFAPRAISSRSPPPPNRISSPSHKGASPPFHPSAILLLPLAPVRRSGSVNNAYTKNAPTEIYRHLLTRTPPSLPINNNAAKRDTRNCRPLRCPRSCPLFPFSSVLSSPSWKASRRRRGEEKKAFSSNREHREDCTVLHPAKLYFVQRTSSMRNRSLSRMNRPHYPRLLLGVACVREREGGRAEGSHLHVRSGAAFTLLFEGRRAASSQRRQSNHDGPITDQQSINWTLLVYITRARARSSGSRLLSQASSCSPDLAAVRQTEQ